MSPLVVIPITCQNGDCKYKFPLETNRRGQYAFYFAPGEYDKHRMRMSRSRLGIEYEKSPVECPLCGEETIVLIMKKYSAIHVHEISPELVMVRPGDMQLPGSPPMTPSRALPSAPFSPDFIEVEKEYRNDKVYDNLIDEINVCYEYEAYSSALVMVRKLIENLLVDILRLKYAPSGRHEFYFDAAKERFLSLEDLVANLEAISSEYSKYGFRSNHLAAIKGLRKKGNISAHSIVDFVDKTKTDSLKKNANQAVIVLLRIVGIIRGILDQEGKPVRRK